MKKWFLIRFCTSSLPQASWKTDCEYLSEEELRERVNHRDNRSSDPRDTSIHELTPDGKKIKRDDLLSEVPW